MPLAANAPIQVRSLDSGGDARWDSFVEAHPEATFFHLSSWKKVIEDSFGHSCHYLFAERDGAIAGVLPLTHIRGRLFGNSLISNGFCVYGGPLAESQDALRALDEAALDLARELKVDRLEYRLRSPLHDDWPCNQETYVTFRKAIGQDQDEELKAIPRKQRAMVRKGIKFGLSDEIDRDTARFYPLYAESVRNLGTPVLSRRYFECLKSVFGDSCEILTIAHDGSPLSSVLSFFFRDEVLPYYGGGAGGARQYAANDFMYWAVMRRACASGIKVFDFGRSKTGTGSYSFKKHWGFTPEALYYEHALLRLDEIPQINPLNPKYALMIAAWKRLPLQVANTVGPLLARELG